jgi:hypothetical protein
MKRFLLLPLSASVLTLLAGAKAPSPSPAADRARALHRDRGLVVKCVDGGLCLARTGDSLQRADCCNDVAARFAEEIEASVRDGDTPRAALLGEHFHRLLVDGVAPNLSAVRQKVPAGSTDERKLLEVGERNTKVADDLIAKLRRPEHGDVEVVLKAVADGRTQVKKALQAPPRN